MPSNEKKPYVWKHQDGSLKLDPSEVPGVNVVPNSDGSQIIALTAKGICRLIRVLVAAQSSGGRS